jgi:MoaA/NifB/PqqE/SkfB family radical SAM enzyme
MKLSGLHLLLTYQCNLECDHCFVWGSPWQSGTMILQNIRLILKQAKELDTIEWIYYEGGEPFLYYAVLLKGTQEAARLGFKVGVLSDCYWATEIEDALEWLKPFAGLIQDLSISSDLYHYSEKLSRQAKNACAAAKKLSIPIGIISIAQPEVKNSISPVGKLTVGESAVMYRGRAVKKLTTRAAKRSWKEFTECSDEDLRQPGRVHLDPFGEVHICQGISLGNVFHSSLSEICKRYDPDSHPIVGPLLEGGPAELIRHYSLSHKESYADACHLCYEARLALRERFPKVLKPDQMYGVPEA